MTHVQERGQLFGGVWYHCSPTTFGAKDGQSDVLQILMVLVLPRIQLAGWEPL